MQCVIIAEMGGVTQTKIVVSLKPTFSYCINAKMQRYRNVKCEMQRCKMLGHRLAQLLMEPFILLYDQYLLLLMSRIAVLCCYVHSEREKQSTPH